jgi:hypothetical protein
MPKFLTGENFLSVHDTMVTLSCYRDGDCHVIRFESEDGQGPTEARFSSRDRARDHWRAIKETLEALGFKRI